MLRSFAIKLLAAVVAIAVLELGSGSGALVGAIAVVLGTIALLAWPVFDVNSSFWAPTLWRSGEPASTVALTFDDGPDPEFTPRVLEILRAKNVPATFFVVGAQVRACPELVARIDRAGHLVGNHSDRHGLDFHFQLWPGFRDELTACNAAIRAAIGKEPRLFRSPQGFKNPALGDVLREMGLLAIGWQVRGLDAIEPDSSKIVHRIVSRVRAGGVVQMHDGAALFGIKSRQATLEALPEVIDRIRGAGLEFVRLDELLGLQPYKSLPERASYGDHSAPPGAGSTTASASLRTSPTTSITGARS